MPRKRAGERIRLRIGDLSKAVLITGQAYQDPRDALNEFVSNAADAYAEAGRRGERVHVALRRKGMRPVIAVSDDGDGMAPERLKEIARNLFRSAKADDPRTIGEKAIGMLAFQQLGARCDVYSRVAGPSDTWVLRLERGKATADLRKAEPHRRRDAPGTTVYLHDLDPDVLRVLTRRKVVDYLRHRRGPALARGEYRLEVQEGRTAELVTPEEPDGVPIPIPARSTLWGRIEFAIYVAASPDRRRRVAVVGRGGTTIIDDVGELDEFADEPWTTDQVSGMIVFDALQQTAGRRAVLRDREAFPVFVDAVRSIEPAVRRTLERVREEVDEQTQDRLAETVRRIFSKVLRDLEDVDNPMRTLVGPGDGEGALFAEERAEPVASEEHEETPPSISSQGGAVEPPERPPGEGSADRGRSRNLPDVQPDPHPDGVRSRYDPDERVVFYNDRHADYLLVKGDEQSLLEYLSTLVAKELVVYNNPRAASAELGEEMVRMLVRVRKHMPRKR